MKASFSSGGTTVSLREEQPLWRHFTAICWEKRAMLTMYLHPRLYSLWAMLGRSQHPASSELCQGKQQEAVLMSFVVLKKERKNNLRITFRLKVEQSFWKLIISSPRRFRSVVVRSKVWTLFWHDCARWAIGLLCSKCSTWLWFLLLWVSARTCFFPWKWR